MAFFSQAEIKQLASAEAERLISLYLPMVKTGDTAQNRIRFKNLLNKVETKLLDSGKRLTEIRALLGPALAMTDNALFWQIQSNTLAMFISPETFQYYHLPDEFQETVAVSKHYFVRPLVSIFNRDGMFYLLGLSQKGIHLWQCSRLSQVDITPDVLPESLNEALPFFEYQKQVQSHGRGQVYGNAAPTAMFFGSGDDSFDNKGRIKEYFQIIDKELRQYFKAAKAPLILTGVDYLLPIYRDINSYPLLRSEFIDGNPDGASPDELRLKGWEIVKNEFEKNAKLAVEEYYLAESRGLGSSDMPQVLVAAHDGRVKNLFTNPATRVYGFFDRDKRQMVRHANEASGDEELVNLAVVYTLRTDGQVFDQHLDKLGYKAEIGATLRY